MATDEGAAQGPGMTGDKRLRPAPPTIDLTANEIPDASAEARRTETEPDTMQGDAADPVAGAGRVASADETPSPDAAPASSRGEHRQGRGALAGALAGAVTGALVAAGLLAGLWWSGWLPDARQQRAGPWTAETERIAALETQLRTLAERLEAAPVPAPQDSELANRITALEQASRRLADLEARIAKAETAAETAAANLQRAPQGDPAPAQAVSEEISVLRKRLDEVAGAAQSARDAAMKSTGATSAAVADTSGEIGRLAERLNAAERSITGMQAAVAKAAGPEADRAARVAVAAIALRAAVERGEPFTGELVAVRGLLGDSPALAPLAAAAADGIAQESALLRELGTLVVTTRRAGNNAERENASVLERLQAGASSLIRVQPVDQSSATAHSGANAGDPLTRLETASVRNDLVAALAEVEKLPAEQQGAFEAWKKKAQSRIAAINAARQIAAQSVSALSASGR